MCLYHKPFSFKNVNLPESLEIASFLGPFEKSDMGTRQASKNIAEMFIIQLLTATRGANKLHLSGPYSNFYRNSFEFQVALHFNNLPASVQTLTSRTAFKTGLSRIEIFWSHYYIYTFYVL